MRISELTVSYFLSVSIIAQQIIAVVFAFYSFYQEKIELVIIYMSVATAIAVALGVFFVYQYHLAAKFILLSTLAAGAIALLVSTTDPMSLIWCLLAVPVLAGTLNHKHSSLLLLGIFSASILLIKTNVVPFASTEYDHKIIIHFLSCYTILIMFYAAMDDTFFNRLIDCKALASKASNTVYRDMLTNLPDRHYMEERLKLMQQKYSLNNSLFSVVLADLDHLKVINDQYGRDTGDKVLQITSALLNNELREDDLVARWSGNQFILLCSDVGLEKAAKIAERLRLKVSQLELEAQGDQLCISVSMGVATADQSIGVDDLLSSAENAVYQAKHMGRNMVIVS